MLYDLSFGRVLTKKSAKTEDPSNYGEEAGEKSRLLPPHDDRSIST